MGGDGLPYGELFAEADKAAATAAAFLASLIRFRWNWYDLDRDRSAKLGMGGGGESPFVNEDMEGDIDMETVGRGGGGGRERDIGDGRDVPSIELVGVNIGGGLLCCCCCCELVCSLKYMDICLRRVELRGPLSCWTASLFIPTEAQRFSRQARHWFRWVLSMTQLPSDLALQTYCRLRRIER